MCNDENMAIILRAAQIFVSLGQQDRAPKKSDDIPASGTFPIGPEKSEIRSPGSAIDVFATKVRKRTWELTGLIAGADQGGASLY
jgi:hypothetical protein